MNKELEIKKTFVIRQITVKTPDNKEAFRLIEKAVNKTKGVQLIITPRVDIGGYPYYWVGLRFDRQELDFKLLVNNEIMDFIKSYLSGAETLPTVLNFNPDEKIEEVKKVEEWLSYHRTIHTPLSIYRKEELTMNNGENYLTEKYSFINGKINYPSTKCEDILSLIIN